MPFEGRAVKTRAGAYGDQWVGTGTARDAEGVERPVLVVADRKVPEPVAAGSDAEEGVDWMERLIRPGGAGSPGARVALRGTRDGAVTPTAAAPGTERDAGFGVPELTGRYS
ncbi:hypothetical protein [Streptomyces rishiriensis]|uniref:Transposase n=1 Tax=Streptomyces rishiriensis TaxID=68264 RepID=A0ABU0P4C2_STRRH|nr:hypothetical protein [Streptomyces rishiriensis]MDQ0585565.1 hypothetical protein [Streptomyces rishiriensis]